MRNRIQPGESVRVHKYLPTENDVHVDQLLTDFSVAYQQDASIDLASSIFPIIPVNHQSGKYYTWPKADWFRDEARKRAPGTPVARGGMRLSTDSYFAEIYEWGDKIPREVANNVDNQIDLDQAAARYVMQILAIRRERDFAAKYLATSIWGTDWTGVASGPTGNQFVQWNSSSSTPVDDLGLIARGIILATGKQPNTLILGYDAWLKLKTNTQLIARVINGQTPGRAAAVSTADMAALFEVDRIIISKAVYNTAKEGQAATMAFINGKIAWLGYVDPNPGIQTLTAGGTFVWNSMPFGSSSGTVIERWWDQSIRSEMVDGFSNWDMKVVAADAGAFLTAVIA